MTYKVTFNSPYNYSVKTTKPVDLKANLIAKIEIMPQNLEDLTDVDVSGVHDKYLIMYNASTQKYTAVNPDEVLSAAVTDPISPGMPSDFMDQLDVDLDNRIDVDAGTF
jgi:hypothetical protein